MVLSRLLLAQASGTSANPLQNSAKRRESVALDNPYVRQRTELASARMTDSSSRRQACPASLDPNPIPDGRPMRDRGSLPGSRSFHCVFVQGVTRE